MKFNFVLIYLVSTTFFAIPIVMNLVILKNAGELDSVETVVLKQISENTLYGSGTNQNTFFYKLALLKAIKPDIVALGSSRVMQFRKEMFNTSFSNAGGAINSVDEAEKFVNEMLKLHKPKIVIFGLDDWWFNPNSQAANWKNPENDTSSGITFEKIIAPYLWMYEGKVTFSDYLHLLLSDDTIGQAKLTHSKLMGISAIKKEAGFRVDGSYFYGNMMIAKNTNDFLFEDTIRRIEKGVDRFEYSGTISNRNWNKYISIINKLKDNGIIVIAFIPPYANAAITKMNQIAQYGYMKELSAKAKSEGFENYRDPNKWGLSNCDFTDGFHGSEVTYLKLLFHLKKLHPFLNRSIANEHYINSLECSLNIPIQMTDKYQESDLLGIGCKRKCKNI